MAGCLAKLTMCQVSLCVSLAGDHQPTPTPVCLVLRCCPDVVIDHPSHGIILKVKAAEIVPTTQFNTNLTFRFPRVESIRRDKVKAVDYAANHVTQADSCSLVCYHTTALV